MLTCVDATENWYLKIGIMSRYDELIVQAVSICWTTKLKSERDFDQ